HGRFLYSDATLRSLHSFPTRRSSDLERHVSLGLCRTGRQAVPGEEADVAPVVTAADLGVQARGDRQRDAQQLQWIVALESDVERSEEHTSELQSRFDIVCRLLLEKKK